MSILLPVILAGDQGLFRPTGRSNPQDELDDQVGFARVPIFGVMVGRGGLEPPTSRLSGVRSNHLSYRPYPGGAYRDRTDDLLNANQALSQLS